MTPPAGYQRLAAGVVCRCPKLWTDGEGGYWCCHPAEPATVVPQIDPRHGLQVTFGRGCMDAPFTPELQALLADMSEPMVCCTGLVDCKGLGGSSGARPVRASQCACYQREVSCRS